MEASAPQSGFLIEQRELQVEPGPIGVLGTGALGEVRRGTFRGALVACKGLFMLRTDARSVAGFGGALRPDERKHLTAKFMQECRFMQECTHPNIVPFFGVAVDDSPAREPLYLVMQYIESGSLQDVIHGARYSDMRTAESGQCLPLEVQAVALVGMFSALEYLAGLRLIHRDVKPANILAVVEEQTLLKVLLADFGEAKQLSMTRAAASIAGTPLYMAPEMREEEEAKSPKADVFSAGVVAVELNTGCVPKPGPEAKKVGRRRVFVDEEERRAGDMARIRDPEIRAIAARCIVDDEEARADASEIAEYCRELLRAVSSAPPETTIVVSHSGGNKTKIAVSAATEVWHVKQQLEMDTGISAQAQELVYAGRALLDDKTVDDYSLLDGTTVQMIARLPEPAVMDHADAATLQAAAAAKSAQAEAADRERGQSGTGPSARVQSDSGRKSEPSALSHELFGRLGMASRTINVDAIIQSGIQKIKEAEALDNEMGAMATDDPARPAKTTAAINSYMEGIDFWDEALECEPGLPLPHAAASPQPAPAVCSPARAPCADDPNASTRQVLTDKIEEFNARVEDLADFREQFIARLEQLDGATAAPARALQLFVAMGKLIQAAGDAEDDRAMPDDVRALIHVLGAGAAAPPTGFGMTMLLHLLDAQTPGPVSERQRADAIAWVESHFDAAEILSPFLRTGPRTRQERWLVSQLQSLVDHPAAREYLARDGLPEVASNIEDRWEIMGTCVKLMYDGKHVRDFLDEQTLSITEAFLAFAEFLEGPEAVDQATQKGPPTSAGDESALPEPEPEPQPQPEATLEGSPTPSDDESADDDAFEDAR